MYRNVSGLIPGSSSLNADVTLSEMLDPKLLQMALSLVCVDVFLTNLQKHW